MQINLTQILPCQLQCKFCLNSKAKMPIEKYDFETFKTTVEICVNHGIYDFSLTPHIGDFALDKDYWKKILFLECHPEVKSWNFITNFLSSDINSFVTLPFKKGSVCISIYGLTQEDYLKATGKDMFEQLCYNLWHIVSCGINLKRINLYIRYDSSPIEKNDMIEQLKKAGAKVDTTEILNKNWGGFIPSDYFGKTKNGICQHAAICDNGIFPDGSMTLCNCWDTFKSLYIGNIFDDGLKKIYSEDSKFGRLIKDQIFNKYHSICRNCNDFELVNIDEIEIPWLKKYINIIKRTREQRNE